jgi:phenylacetate-CoA ligase
VNRSWHRESATVQPLDALRKTLYRAGLQMNTASRRALHAMRRDQWLPRQDVMAIQQERLEDLLVYANGHVPFYSALFARAGLVADGRLRMDRFTDLPPLDKPTIRRNPESLRSDEAPALHARENRTSGSTGEPIVVLQARDEVRVTGGAVIRLFYEWHDIRPGDREVKLWGSERDLFHAGGSSWETLRQWAAGVKTLNAFQMTPDRMRGYIGTINTYRPRLLRGYSSNLFELARFAEGEKLAVRPPAAVISSAGTLYPHLREKVEEVYGAPVYNHYGSREMHSMAMECPARAGLHVSAFTHLIEVLDETGRPCAPGVEGDLVITALLNRAMPLIRYRIGDRGSLSEAFCPCGRGLPLLARLSGRRVDCFWTRDGRMVPGEYFIYLLAVHLVENPIEKYQVIQEEFDRLRFRLVLRADSRLSAAARTEIEEKTQLVMGQSCGLSFEFPDDIPPARSGKYLYTICELPGAAEAATDAQPASGEC